MKINSKRKSVVKEDRHEDYSPKFHILTRRATLKEDMQKFREGYLSSYLRLKEYEAPTTIDNPAEEICECCKFHISSIGHPEGLNYTRMKVKKKRLLEISVIPRDRCRDSVSMWTSSDRLPRVLGLERI